MLQPLCGTGIPARHNYCAHSCPVQTQTERISPPGDDEWHIFQYGGAVAKVPPGSASRWEILQVLMIPQHFQDNVLNYKRSFKPFSERLPHPDSAAVFLSNSSPCWVWLTGRGRHDLGRMWTHTSKPSAGFDRSLSRPCAFMSRCSPTPRSMGRTLGRNHASAI
jgi:hypothetical protein